MLAGQLALITAALFAGAAIYINVAEQPSRLQLDDRALLNVWKPAYKRVYLDRVRCAADAPALHAALSLAQCPKPPAHSKRWTSV